MEYIDGENIGDFISDYFAPFAETTLDDVFLQLIDAFCYIEAHGIIHRDIREGNILVDKSGTVKVIDFGIGKIASRVDGGDADSLVADINRAASDTLPQEYYDGIYTSLTDMFYLAELFGRLIDNAGSCDRTDFSYNDILNKMMEKKPENRFESFAAIREAIGKHDFLHMQISDEDREIYQEFTNLIYKSLHFHEMIAFFDNIAARGKMAVFVDAGIPAIRLIIEIRFYLIRHIQHFQIVHINAPQRFLIGYAGVKAVTVQILCQIDDVPHRRTVIAAVEDGLQCFQLR